MTNNNNNNNNNNKSGLQHESCSLNQTYNIFTTVTHNTKNVVGF